ncbi:MurR/RpiR family transcriptional regulator [Oceaniglobus trochenteri]|uniref:MurR/RpiR family transcriptional regulator n=1 Tax=Oceaniglobus trochenteri TaxID=2763260 RepID=UPI001CFFF9D7|nr:MurR/RpiR family transcriptional regulator [Oceaniglobus trochenteri]
MHEDEAMIEQRLRSDREGFTRAEKQLVAALLDNYPMAGLGSISELAAAADVSTPTVVRLARKLGFDGFSDFQRALRAEVSAQIRAPLSKKDLWSTDPGEAHPLNRFADAISMNVRSTLQRVDIADFDAVTALLADRQCAVSIAGGRITRSLADYLFNHLQILRPGVQHLSQSSNVWPQYLVDMNADTVLVMFDIRRYESDLLKLARLAEERGARIVLFTDQWGSPVGRHARFRFHASVEVPSSWDSTVAIMLLVEALVAQVQETIGAESRERIEELEGMFGKTRLFRNFT